MTDITKYLSQLELPQVGVTDILEILIIAYILYHLLVWVKNTRTWFLLKGVAVLVGFFVVAVIMQFNTILFIAERSISVIVIAVIVVFQPELRKALEQLGKGNVLFRLFASPVSPVVESGFSQQTVEEIVRASAVLAVNRTGALIVIEKEVPLTEYIRTGISLDAILTSQLLVNIFEHNTPLHDGAVIVQGNRIVAATCYLPLSNNTNISKDLGTRHRAGLGVSEATDSFTIIVSEESGQISLAAGGRLRIGVTAEELREQLEKLMEPRSDNARNLKWWEGLRSNEKKNPE